MHGATGIHFLQSVGLGISIHAPYAGSDDISVCTNIITLKFQSTLPMQGATLEPYRLNSIGKFQSTLPMQGATAKVNNYP